MSLKKSIKKLFDFYEGLGFKENDNLSQLFKFRPDFVFESSEKYIGIYTRNSASINTSILERIAQTKTIKKLFSQQVILFNSLPDDNTLLECSQNGVEVCYLEKGILKFIKAEELSIDDEKDIEYDMPKMSVFVSSKQDIVERKQTIKIINRINLKYQKPIYPFAVEINKRSKVLSKKELRLEIMNGIDDCEYFFGILTEEKSQATENEVLMALKMKNPNKIRLYVKDTKKTKETWKDLLNEIESKYIFKGKTTWYYPFLDLFDLEDEVRKDIIEILSKKHRDNGSFFV